MQKEGKPQQDADSDDDSDDDSDSSDASSSEDDAALKKKMKKKAKAAALKVRRVAIRSMGLYLGDVKIHGWLFLRPWKSES